LLKFLHNRAGKITVPLPAVTAPQKQAPWYACIPLSSLISFSRQELGGAAQRSPFAAVGPLPQLEDQQLQK
jgi:hypothetical protein